MSTKQKIALIAPPVLVGLEIFVFRFLAGMLGEKLGWYVGLITYWLVWGGLFSIWLIGKDGLREIITPQRLTLRIALLLTVPIFGSLAYKLVPTMDYQQQSVWLSLMMVSTAFGNGFFEEVLWRGVYLKLFPENILIRIFWASLWFALWHYAPGSVSKNGSPIPLMIGSAFLGFYSSFLAHKTKTIWWSIVAHVVGGIIMVS